MKQEIMSPILFDMIYHTSFFWGGELIGIMSTEQRDRLYRYNANLSFYICNENNEKYNVQNHLK